MVSSPSSRNHNTLILRDWSRLSKQITESRKMKKGPRWNLGSPMHGSFVMEREGQSGVTPVRSRGESVSNKRSCDGHSSGGYL